MNLGELIGALKKLPPTLAIRIGAPEPLAPVGFGSYRGYYDDLAIEFSAPRPSLVCPTVGSFLDLALACIGKHFSGYKGGEYRMHEATRLWVSNWGWCSGFLVTDVSVGGVICETAYINGRMAE